ncbi:T6SS immunity protein Tli4 family protein [Commensalibacter nepenthis]|uniref:T6SS immunity protein Tli4 family protein n=1 Tax=Commensalibacter nepenthis TaxID=3043872 RepID=A0ABT6QAG9_9PROT|nr:T6SS immunity protein Tli4 family protein [Commensalibacter sp. TBRC 10068]MDI2113905.1 T6SS immunity protein Tli4 family protein [Commensalibacter sp. TBRC 10068]
MSEIKHNPYTQNLTPRCVGRFLIDIPAEFISGTTNDKPTQDQINQHQLFSQPMTEKEFNTQLWMREEELKDDKKHVFVKSEDKPYLKETYPLKDGRKGVVFNHNEGVGNKDALRELEGHLFSNNVGIILKIKATVVDDPRYERDRRVFKFVTDLPQKRNEIQSLLSRMEGWDNLHPPQGKGTCYQNVFIKGPAGDYEYAGNQYFYKNNKELNITIEYDTDIHSKDTMLGRSSEIKQYASEAPEGKIIRFSKRDTDYIHAEEFLASGKNEQTGKTEYTFILRMNEMNGTPQTPAITITLQNNDVISEKDALAIWDAIIPTLKPRTEAY